MTALLEVRDLKKHFAVGGLGGRRTLRAVDGVTFSLAAGEVVGVVGESGCGKTTLGRTVVRLYRPTAGRILYRGRDVTFLGERDLRGFRREVQMIFQDPYASLDPRMTVAEIVGEPFTVAGALPPRERRGRVRDLLEMVGLTAEHADRFPHELSGGQRQRVGIARALALQPALVVADEPVSSLDVSIRAQVLNVLQGLREELGLALLLIAHDLAMVRHLSDRVLVMYLGQVVEEAPADAIHARPAHPYTRALIAAVPVPDPAVEAQRRRLPLEGEVPSPLDSPAGCRFHPRCPMARDRCRAEAPVLREVAPGRRAACHLL